MNKFTIFQSRCHCKVIYYTLYIYIYVCVGRMKKCLTFKKFATKISFHIFLTIRECKLKIPLLIIIIIYNYNN